MDVAECARRKKCKQDKPFQWATPVIQNTNGKSLLPIPKYPSILFCIYFARCSRLISFRVTLQAFKRFRPSERKNLQLQLLAALPAAACSVLTDPPQTLFSQKRLELKCLSLILFLAVSVLLTLTSVSVPAVVVK